MCCSLFGFLPPTLHLQSDFTLTCCREAIKNLLRLVHMLSITLLAVSVSRFLFFLFFLTGKQHSSYLGVISPGSLSGRTGGDSDRLCLFGQIAASEGLLCYDDLLYQRGRHREQKKPQTKSNGRECSAVLDVVYLCELV